ncbi:type II toxin-antitoxin system death-on-curing family toxin [Pseudoroseomonas wenyumeiae]|uniref:Type II toxin-antitoxin system death-on-curing family toxin n=1 Tax=Teichococcus wenyumeiae TaxID=2478470 RepID=A0A3A9J663_9PROT|nr:type II toxin-antitoxin system death-on-curing family toxin [Pseudoroseomonas wenyumeiae]RKK01410.1 type II toxin-antitoxin system death-on-curing family toxin [Pseudoroseomonas wenyumeiae]RMI17016.1 type II toxin-antitoxin system death-on-curing family toxin [Pseudoroseomonas wenyumeiae]
MTDPEFLETDAVAFLHDWALREYGGAQGIKDPDLLESALGRPLNKLAYAGPEGVDLYDLAAAYAYGIARNHAFNDANKRTAWSCCVLFLKVNGIALRIEAAKVVEQMVALAQGHVEEADFAAWLRQHRHPK